MKTEIATLWINALLSGDYKQVKGKLHSESGFCCLGVLCDLFKKETNKGRWKMGEEEHAQFYIGEEIATGVLPEAVVDWAGLDSNIGKFHAGPSLIILNDGGKSFAEIAEIISLTTEEL